MAISLFYFCDMQYYFPCLAFDLKNNILHGYIVILCLLNATNDGIIITVRYRYNGNKYMISLENEPRCFCNDTILHCIILQSNRDKKDVRKYNQKHLTYYIIIYRYAKLHKPVVLGTKKWLCFGWSHHHYVATTPEKSKYIGIMQ